MPRLKSMHGQAFAALTDVIKADRYLHPHYRFYVREVRKAAYVQVRRPIPAFAGFCSPVSAWDLIMADSSLRWVLEPCQCVGPHQGQFQPLRGYVGLSAGGTSSRPTDTCTFTQLPHGRGS